VRLRVGLVGMVLVQSEGLRVSCTQARSEAWGKVLMHDLSKRDNNHDDNDDNDDNFNNNIHDNKDVDADDDKSDKDDDANDGGGGGAAYYLQAFEKFQRCF
jgi:hypothetical protein